MQCAIAFLLLSAKDPDNMDRLVVTQFETNAPSYGIYELADGRNFPNPKLIDQHDVILESAMKYGTNIMSYCSESLQSQEIVDRITSGMTDITARAHLHWNENLEAETECYRSLKSVINSEEKIDVNIMSKFPSRMKSKCTNQVILNLAFSGIIAVDGVYRKYAPPKADQPVVVTLDEPMKLRSLLLNGELIKGTKTTFGQEALAWYQGHLHLFKRNKNRDAWLPVTTIGHENFNGWLIANFINANFPEINKSWNEYYGKCAKYKNILRKLSESEERIRFQNRLHWSDDSYRSYNDPDHRYNDLLDVCHADSDRIFFKIYDYHGYYHFFDVFFNHYYHNYVTMDENRAKKYRDTIYAVLKKLLPRKLPTSLASGITMPM
ncbi:putative effector protein [Blumeria hordei DH14]|uniref:Putative effector protein n=1 Tax=Blumeria graminis f. sp. hordei (strain DH14) TaxID=546991 RepID=N1JJJ3_BLUG1|nr:putative effector protein [Blumeria hordei DH14]